MEVVSCFLPVAAVVSHLVTMVLSCWELDNTFVS